VAHQLIVGSAGCAGGDEIAFARADGTWVRFAVERTEQHDRQRFPIDAVYYPTLTLLGVQGTRRSHRSTTCR
jgi:hypothetical protein